MSWSPDTARGAVAHTKVINSLDRGGGNSKVWDGRHVLGAESVAENCL